MGEGKTGGPTSKAEAMRNSDPPPSHELFLASQDDFCLVLSGVEEGLLEKTGPLNIRTPPIHRRGPKVNGPLLGAISVSLIR